jgi:predicted SAM-dependent methyltransferase
MIKKVVRTIPRKIAKKTAKKSPVIGRIIKDRDQLLADNRLLHDRLQEDLRSVLSRRYIHGNGIEIGALHMPLTLAEDAQAKYVDYLSVEDLRKQYPELKKLPLVDVSIVDDAEKLTKVKNNSQDFIIANHFLEHCQDPIGTLITLFKKLHAGGILYMAIPDKRYTFDMYRPLTTYTHLLDEHRVYPEKKFFEAHCKEIVKFTERVNGTKQLQIRTQDLVDKNYSIHHHVWTQKELVEFFYKTAEKFSLNLEIEAIANNVHEVIFIIRKIDKKSETEKIKSIRKHYFKK